MSTPRARGALIANLLGQLAFGLLAMTICLPSMAEWGATFGAPQSTVQLTFSGFVFTYGLLQLVYGPLSDRLGGKRVLLGALALSCAAALLAALAPSLPLLIAARILQGAGAAAGMVVGRAMVQQLFQGPERTRVMAYIGMAMGLCPPTATLVGGQLHVLLGWRANFVLMALLAVLMALAAWRGLPGPVQPGPPSPGTTWLRPMLAGYARLGRERLFWLYVSSLALTTAAFYAFLGAAPIVLAGYGVGPQRVGLYIMCIPLSYLVGNYLTSHWVQRTGERPIQAAGHALTLLGVGLLLAGGLAGWQTPLALALPLLVLGLGHGLHVPPTLAGTVGLVPALAGTAAAVAGLGQQWMGALGGYVVGLVTHHGALNLAWVMAGASVGAALAMGLAAHLQARAPAVAA